MVGTARGYIVLARALSGPLALVEDAISQRKGKHPHSPDFVPWEEQLVAKDEEITRLRAQIGRLGEVNQDAMRQLAEAQREVERLKYYLEQAGWRRCDVAACNCGGYHEHRKSDLEARCARLEAHLAKALNRERHHPFNHDYIRDEKSCVDCRDIKAALAEGQP